MLVHLSAPSVELKEEREGRVGAGQLWDMGPSGSVCRIYNLLGKPTPKQCCIRKDATQVLEIR